MKPAAPFPASGLPNSQFPIPNSQFSILMTTTQPPRVTKTIDHFRDNVPAAQKNLPSALAWLFSEQFPEWEPLFPTLPQGLLGNLRAIVTGDNRAHIKVGQLHLQLVGGYANDENQLEIPPETRDKALTLVKEAFDLIEATGNLVFNHPTSPAS